MQETITQTGRLALDAPVRVRFTARTDEALSRLAERWRARKIDIVRLAVAIGVEALERVDAQAVVARLLTAQNDEDTGTE